jgi:hypothetical protein
LQQISFCFFFWSDIMRKTTEIFRHSKHGKAAAPLFQLLCPQPRGYVEPRPLRGVTATMEPWPLCGFPVNWAHHWLSRRVLGCCSQVAPSCWVLDWRFLLPLYQIYQLLNFS